MRIALVNPPRVDGIPAIREERCEITERYSVLEPYSLLQLASILREDGHDVHLLDCNGFDHDFQFLKKWMRETEYDAIIFRFTPTTFDRDTETAALSKRIRPAAKTIGICWTLRNHPEEVLESCNSMDFYLRHEYEVVAKDLLRALKNGDSLTDVGGISFRNSGKVYVTLDAEPIGAYDSLPMPAYDLLPNLDPYFINTPGGKPFTIIYSSKGCPFNCIFCTVANTKWKPRSAESVLAELRYLKEHYDVRTVSFFDETFTINRDRVIRICRAMKNEAMGINWYCNTRVHLVDPPLLREMHDGGCRGISFGVESGSQKILDAACKGTSVMHAENAIKWTTDAGMKAFCSFIFGLPGETWGTVEETLDFVRRTLPTGAQFNVAVPYPGTRLHEIAEDQHLLQNADWRRYYQHESVMRTSEMSPEQLNDARKIAYRSLYANPKWIAKNLGHVIRNPEDFSLAVRYCMKIADNLFVHGMKHAH